MMRKSIVFTVLMIMISIGLTAQNIRLNGYAGYTFDDKFDSYYDASSYYNGRINGGLQWGVGIELKANPDYGVELLYYRQDTKAPTTYFSSGVKRTDFDLGVNYILLATNRYLHGNAKVEPYGSALIGAAILNIKNPDNGNSGSKTKFAVGGRLGCNIWASKNVGIKLQAQLLSAVQGVGGGFYFGTGGTGAGLATYSSMLQFGLGGGLVFNLTSGKK